MEKSSVKYRTQTKTEEQREGQQKEEQISVKVDTIKYVIDVLKTSGKLTTHTLHYHGDTALNSVQCSVSGSDTALAA